MNLLSANPFTVYLNNIFADWVIALFVFFAVLILLAVLFKGLKVGIILIVISAVVAGGFVLAAFITMLVTWDTLRIIDFAIKWGPTILFTTIITISTLVNAKRGLRKSLILLAQAVGACVVCIIFYYCCINSVEMDKLTLAAINGSMRGNTLQNMLGVSEECSTIREIFVEYIPKAVGGDFQILLAENPQYIVTVADMAFRIVFALVTLLIYFVLVFILYVIYFFAYPERRHKKKVNLAVSKNTADRPYTKNHIGGGAVGLVRGITVGLLSLSFIGSAFFIVAGGKGNGVSGDYDLDNDEYNDYYSIYRSVESYGAQGIFKVLNLMSDATDTPFYLFAADMVLSGNLDDEENGVDNQNIIFREEFGELTGFARDTFNLLMKYGEDDIVAIINGQGGDNAFDTIVQIMSKPEFREEFDKLIDGFDSQPYVINLGMSLVNSIVANIDDISFTSSISEDNRELIKIMFKKGHLSDVIPEEHALKQDIAAGVPVAAEELARPRIKVSHLLEKTDVQLILRVALSFLSGEQQTDDALQMVKTLLPDIRQLSILQTSRAEELDPVLARVYCFLANKYLTEEETDRINYSDIAKKGIKWLDELNVIMDVADDAFTLWGNIYEEGKEPLDMALSVFDESGEHFTENVACYDNIRAALQNSDIIGTVMSTSFMYDLIYNALSAISTELYIPEDITYNRTVNADGSVTEGEIYQLLGGFKLLTSPENRELLNMVIDYTKGAEVDTVELLAALSDALTVTDADGHTLSAYFTESALLRSVLSIVMIEKGEDTLYVPHVSLDKLESGEAVNMINKRELKQLLENLSELVNFVKPLLEGDSNSEHIASIAEYLQQDKFAQLVEENRIYEGTVAHLLSIFIDGNEFIVVPKNLLDSVDGWVTVDGKKGELRNLLDALKSAEFDLVGIADGDFDATTIFDTLLTFDRYKAEDFLESEILHYTLSKYLIDGPDYGGFGIIVPVGAREETAEGDSIEYVVKKSELLNLFDAVSYLDISGEMDISSVLYKIATNKPILNSSKIIAASIIYTVVNNSQMQSAITIPTAYSDAGTKETLQNYNSSNPWSAELPRFIDALDEILGISQKGESFVFDDEGVKSSLSALLTGLNDSSFLKPELTKLNLCYLSDIARSEITTRLDSTLLDGGIVTEEVVREAKSQGYYKQTELQSLSDALDIFNIDLLNTDSAEITSAVTDMALKLNEPRSDYDGRTALGVIYPSNIISYIFGKEIDKALEGRIDGGVITYIKGGRNTYPQEDVAGFIDAVNEIGITTFDELSTFDFTKIGDLNSPAEKDAERSRLEVIYSARVVAGIITKSLYDTLNSGEISTEVIDHSEAYAVKGVKIYKMSEVQSIYDLFGNFETLDIRDVNLQNVSKCLYDENGHTSSYLIAASASALFKSSDRFIVPINVLDEEGCIAPRETSLIIEVFSALYGENDLNNLDTWEITEIPGGAVREKTFESEILRARITYEIGQASFDQGKDVYVSDECVKSVLDVKDVTRLIISHEEFTALAAALEAITGSAANTSFDVPTFSTAEIASYDETTLDTLLKSDVIRYKICECLLNDAGVNAYLTLNGIVPEEKTAVNVYTGVSAIRQIITDEQIKQAYTFIKSYT